MPIDVSIIIINYNSEQYTLKCLKSIYQYSHGFNFEIILIDNASTDFNKYKLIDSFPAITVIDNKINIGFSKANNQGINIAQGEYILLLNNDTELIENSIGICLKKLKSDRSIGVITPQIIYPDGKPQNIANKFPSILNEILELFRITKILPKDVLSKRFLGRYFNHKSNDTVDWVWATFFMFPRKVLQELPENKLPDQFFMYYEDVLWCYRIKKLEYKVYYYNQTNLIHHLSKSLSKTSLSKNSMILDNEWSFLKKEKNLIYAFFYFLLKSLVLITQKDSHLRNYGMKYLKKLLA